MRKNALIYNPSMEPKLTTPEVIDSTRLGFYQRIRTVNPDKIPELEVYLLTSQYVVASIHGESVSTPHRVLAFFADGRWASIDKSDPALIQALNSGRKNPITRIVYMEQNVGLVAIDITTQTRQLVPPTQQELQSLGTDDMGWVHSACVGKDVPELQRKTTPKQLRSDWQ